MAMSTSQLRTALYDLELAFVDRQTLMKFNGQQLALIVSILGLLVFASFFIVYLSTLLVSHDDGLPIINRRFFLEPRVFARFRWAVNARNILKEANDKVRIDLRPYHDGIAQ